MVNARMARGLFVNMVLMLSGLVGGTRVRNIYWNTTTSSKLSEPMMVTVNEGNQAWEYDQVNIICPVYKEGEEQEQHIIYSVEKEEFENCRVTSPSPRIVAICNRPRTFMYFTLTFRSFTPTPGGLEFRPGQDYYFVSTSSKLDIHRRVGGYCATHNMRMVFRVAEREEEEVRETSPSPVPTPAAYWSRYWNSLVPGSREEYVHSKQASSLEFQQSSRETYFGHEVAGARRDRTVDIRITGRISSSSSNCFSANSKTILVFLLPLLMHLDKMWR